MDTQTVFGEADSLGAHLYVLVDPLQNGSLPDALSVRSDHVACLMDGGADVQAVSPHLVYIPPSHFESARAWLERHGPSSPCATMLASPVPLAALAAHLKSFLRVRLPDGEPIVLAYCVILRDRNTAELAFSPNRSGCVSK